MVERTDDEINDVLDRAIEHVSEGRTQWRGMTYEQGVANALEWVTGQVDDDPMDD